MSDAREIAGSVAVLATEYERMQREAIRAAEVNEQQALEIAELRHTLERNTVDGDRVAVLGREVADLKRQLHESAGQYNRHTKCISDLHIENADLKRQLEAGRNAETGIVDWKASALKFSNELYASKDRIADLEKQLAEAVQRGAQGHFATGYQNAKREDEARIHSLEKQLAEARRPTRGSEYHASLARTIAKIAFIMHEHANAEDNL